jgi:uncharacterized CHY-type Zn-finger protein
MLSIVDLCCPNCGTEFDEDDIAELRSNETNETILVCMECDKQFSASLYVDLADITEEEDEDYDEEDTDKDEEE